jgi:hypothetical protein
MMPTSGGGSTVQPAQSINPNLESLKRTLSDMLLLKTCRCPASIGTCWVNDAPPLPNNMRGGEKQWCIPHARMRGPWIVGANAGSSRQRFTNQYVGFRVWRRLDARFNNMRSGLGSRPANKCQTGYAAQKSRQDLHRGTAGYMAMPPRQKRRHAGWRQQIHGVPGAVSRWMSACSCEMQCLAAKSNHNIVGWIDASPFSRTTGKGLPQKPKPRRHFPPCTHHGSPFGWHQQRHPAVHGGVEREGEDG